ncbi:MAG: hypothetical protein HY707_09795 [Ignavibacteriae bacterium]|nr:hypothetical protein [Ignavibacteriota bacterium]
MKSPTAQPYSTLFTNLIQKKDLMPLSTGTPDETIVNVLKKTIYEQVFGFIKVSDKTAARLCLAGLWLLYDHLDECHKIAQSIETKEGSYWHAIMHRREEDFSNSKYWFRQVGDHPIFSVLFEKLKKLSASSVQEQSTTFLREQKRWDPFAFVDLCESAVNTHTPLENLCRQIQQVEWQLLFDYCYNKAVGRQ